MQPSATSILMLAETRCQDLFTDAALARCPRIGRPARRTGGLSTARCRAAVGGLLVRAGRAVHGGPTAAVGAVASSK